MNKVEELIQAATSLFQQDRGLQREIAQELRAHLEDSMEDARATGADEAQAEESALRAFGDPREIGQQLWQANRRRLRRRAIIKWSSIWTLMIGLVALAQAAWRHGWLYAGFPPGSQATAIALTIVGLIILGSLPLLPKTARPDLAFLLWLPRAFWRSLVTAFSTPWIWAPTIAALILNGLYDYFWFARFVSENQQAFAQEIIPTGFFSHMHYWYARAVHPRGPDMSVIGLACIVLLIFAVQVGRLLRTKAGLEPAAAKRWHWTLLFSACITALLFGSTVLGILSYIAPHWMRWYPSSAIFSSRWEWLAVYSAATLASLPALSLLTGAYFTLMLQRLRRDKSTFGSVLKGSFSVLMPLTLLGAIMFLLDVVLAFAVQTAGGYAPLRAAFATIGQFADPVLSAAGLCTAFLPVIILCERCGLGAALMRFATFLWRHLWRYVTLIVFGMFLQALPPWLIGLAVGPRPVNSALFYMGTRGLPHAISVVVLLAMTVMCFEFYLTKAGTEEVAAKKIEERVATAEDGAAGK